MLHKSRGNGPRAFVTGFIRAGPLAAQAIRLLLTPLK